MLDQGKAVRSIDFYAEEKAVLKQLTLITAETNDVCGQRGGRQRPCTQQALSGRGCLRRNRKGAGRGRLRQHGSRDRRHGRYRQDGVLKDLGLEEPGLNRVIRAGYDLLGLQTYFTAGVKEVRAWTIHKGDTAPQGVIHTDFEKGFIRAQTISFADFIQYKGEHGAKEAGKMRAEGKEYVVQDGDVLNFLFNV